MRKESVEFGLEILLRLTLTQPFPTPGDPQTPNSNSPRLTPILPNPSQPQTLQLQLQLTPTPRLPEFSSKRNSNPFQLQIFQAPTPAPAPSPNSNPNPQTTIQTINQDCPCNNDEASALPLPSTNCCLCLQAWRWWTSRYDPHWASARSALLLVRQHRPAPSSEAREGKSTAWAVDRWRERKRERDGVVVFDWC